ncbi:MAG: class I SAM-dependent methyltransferase [Phycisphaerae bacterium]
MSEFQSGGAMTIDEGVPSSVESAACDTGVTLADRDTLQQVEATRSVWERLWKHEPSPEKDDRLLARERRNPRWQHIVDRLTSRFGSLEGLRTVELGSGRGDLSALLAARGASVTLLDQHTTALAQAERRFSRLGLPASFVQGDMLSLPRSMRGSFDVSLSSGVIEHFRGRTRTETIRSHRYVLGEQGMSVISVPHAHCPSYRLWKAYLEFRGWWPYGMEIPYSAKEMTRRCLDAGFRDVEAFGLGFWQSMGDHVVKTATGRAPDWIEERSRWDRRFGGTLLVFAG